MVGAPASDLLSCALNTLGCSFEELVEVGGSYPFLSSSMPVVHRAFI
jgi:hypothetical protein